MRSPLVRIGPPAAPAASEYGAHLDHDHRRPAPPRRTTTFLLLGELYVSQFLGVGFFLIALTAILRERGVGLEQIGLINVLGPVWAIKFLWAPLLDRYGSRRHGHYRGWLLVLQPAIAVLLLVMIPFDVVDDLGTVIALVAGGWWPGTGSAEPCSAR